jgi:hypothetical protein
MTFVVVAIVCADVVVVAAVAAAAATVAAATSFSAVVGSAVGVAVVNINVNSVLAVGTVIVDSVVINVVVVDGAVVVDMLSPLGHQDDVVGSPLDVFKSVRGAVVVLYFYQFFFVVTIVFPYIDEELHFCFEQIRGRADPMGSAECSLESPYEDFGIMARVPLDHDICLCWFPVDGHDDLTTAMTFDEAVKKGNNTFLLFLNRKLDTRMH